MKLTKLEECIALILLGALVVAVMVFVLSSCSLYNLERKLNPGIRAWYEKHWVIMEYPIPKDMGKGSERGYFLRLPVERQILYISKFWDMREIGMEEEYRYRLAVCAGMFRGEGIDTWMTERGRVMLLYGPPFDEQHRNERGELYNEGEEGWGYARQEGRRWFKHWFYWHGAGFWQQLIILKFEWDGIDKWRYIEESDWEHRSFKQYWQWRMAPTPEGWKLWQEVK